MVEDAVLDERTINLQAVIPILPGPCIDASQLKVDHDLHVPAIQEDAPIDPNGDGIGLRQERLEPVLQGAQYVHLATRQGTISSIDYGLFSHLVRFQVLALAREDRRNFLVGE